MDEKTLRNYAELLIKRGVNLQKKQELVIHADVRDAYFARIINDAAYEAGASSVTTKWDDEHMTKSYYLRADNSKFGCVPPWLPVFYDYYDFISACNIFIDSDDPDLLSDASPSRLKTQQIARNKALTRHRKLQMENHVRWTIGAVPSPQWAKKIFPGMPEDRAVKKLWDAIAKAARIDRGDPVAAWDAHLETFKARLAFFEEHTFKYLRYKNAIGTDVTVELPKDHLWLGGAETDIRGIPFSANIPTEEIFTTPKNTGVNGKIVASMPLIYNGVTIEDFEFDFTDGKVVGFKAGKNAETLGNILDMDEGAKRLGEVALVPHDSPISNMNLLFYNTLFDENASCHFALGKAYPCVKGYGTMSKQDLEAAGINDSLIHVDFMVGTADMRITGVTESGREIPVFENGNYSIQARSHLWNG